MRHLWIAIALASLPAVVGCATDCGPPNKFNGLTYRVFANPVEWTPTDSAFTEAPTWWSYGSPSNGESLWTIDWSQAAQGPVTVTIDGQAFPGEGSMNPTECGHATMHFAGTYVDDDDVEHAFDAQSTLTLWSDAGGPKLGALMIWGETWTTPDGQSGTFSAASHVSGALAQ